MKSRRSFLFLQGVASPFFSELGKALSHAGHSVCRINFCGGDYFLSKPFLEKQIKSINFREPLEKLPVFIETVINENNITDIVLFGDTRPVHQAAIQLAKQHVINIHVFEEGYLRPSWITLEKQGVNAHSTLSKNPEWYTDWHRNWQQTQKHSEQQVPVAKVKDTGKQLLPRALHDMSYHFASFMLRPMFSNYRTHRPETPLVEYIGWIKRFPRVSLLYKKPAKKIIAQVLNQRHPFYVLPLQLNADAQIKLHSPLKTVLEVIATALQSFAKNAPINSLLIIKNHPLDTGLVDYKNEIKKACNTNDIPTERVLYIETGDLNTLLDQATGTVLVNSTVGISALQANCPTFAIGKAIYDIRGLTYQGSLDAFWQAALLPENKPDQKLFQAFRFALIELNQINGDFYTKKGIKMAVSGSLRFLERSIEPQQYPKLNNENTQLSNSKSTPSPPISDHTSPA